MKADFDAEKLWQFAKDGKTATELMEECGIATKQTLKNALMELMMEKGEVIKVNGLMGREIPNPKMTATGIRLSPALLSDSDFSEGDEFKVKISSDSITLTKI